MKQAGECCRLALSEIRRRPLFWLGLGAAQVLILWSQDQVPFLGTLVASIFSVFVLARAFDSDWRRFARPLLYLGLLNFPITALWLILSSLHANASWFAAISPLWSLPILFFMSVGLWVAAFTVARITAGVLSLDAALRGAAQDLWRKATTCFWLSVIMALLFVLSYMTQGFGFFLVAPFTLGLLKVGRDSVKINLAP